MHCTGIGADKQLATREERGEIGNRRLAHQTNRWAFYSGGDRVRNLLFGGCSEENDIRVCLKAQAVYEIGEALWRPALRGAVRSPGAYGNSCRIDASAPSEPGGIKGVLEQQGDVKLLGPKFLRQTLASAETFVCTFRIVGNEFVAYFLPAIKVRNIRPGNDCNPRLRKTRANGPQRG